MERRGLDSKARQNHVLLRKEKVHKNTRNHTGKHNKHSEKGTGTTGLSIPRRLIGQHEKIRQLTEGNQGKQQHRRLEVECKGN